MQRQIAGPRWSGFRSSARSSILAGPVCLGLAALLPAGPCLAGAEPALSDSTPGGASIASGLAPLRSTPLTFREDARVVARPVDASAGPALFETAFRFSGLDLRVPAGERREDFLGRYRQALVRESRRAIEKDGSLFWIDAEDEDRYPERRARRRAEKIFSGANGRLLSDLLEGLMDGSPGLRAARGYVEGVSLDLVRGEGVKVSGLREERSNAAASLNLAVTGRPRLELRTELPGGVRARVEVPLTSAGVRGTLSRRLAGPVRGTLSGGIEDGGEDRWISATLDVRF